MSSCGDHAENPRGRVRLRCAPPNSSAMAVKFLILRRRLASVEPAAHHDQVSVLIGCLDVIFLCRRRPTAPTKLTQICHYLTPHPRDAVCGLQPDSPGKLSLGLEPIDRGHRVRNQGQQLGPENERGLDAREPPKWLWHGPSMPQSTSCLLWCFVGFCGDVPTTDRSAPFHPLRMDCLRFGRLGRSESPRYKAAFMRRSSLGGTVATP